MGGLRRSTPCRLRFPRLIHVSGRCPLVPPFGHPRGPDHRSNLGQRRACPCARVSVGMCAPTDVSVPRGFALESGPHPPSVSGQSVSGPAQGLWWTVGPLVVALAFRGPVSVRACPGGRRRTRGEPSRGRPGASSIRRRRREESASPGGEVSVNGPRQGRQTLPSGPWRRPRERRTPPRPPRDRSDRLRGDAYFDLPHSLPPAPPDTCRPTLGGGRTGRVGGARDKWVFEGGLSPVKCEQSQW